MQWRVTMLESVLITLRALRSPFVFVEAELHQQIITQFNRMEIPYRHEMTIGKLGRIDFWVDGIGIEVKKGKPNIKMLINQLTQYSHSEQIKQLIVVSQKKLNLPTSINNKPVYVVALDSMWGVAI